MMAGEGAEGFEEDAGVTVEARRGKAEVMVAGVMVSRGGRGGEGKVGGSRGS